METKRSDKLQVLSEEWTAFVAKKRGEWVEMTTAGNDATLPSLEQFLGAEIAKHIITGG